MIEAAHYSQTGARHKAAFALPGETTSTARSTSRSCTRRSRPTWATSARARPRPRPGASSPAATRSPGSRRAPAGPAPARAARRSGGAAASSSARFRGTTARTSPEGAAAGPPLGAQCAGPRGVALRGGRDGVRCAQDQPAGRHAREDGPRGEEGPGARQRREPEPLPLGPEHPDRAGHELLQRLGVRRDLVGCGGGGAGAPWVRPTPTRPRAPRCGSPRRPSRPRRPSPPKKPAAKAKAAKKAPAKKPAAKKPAAKKKKES